MYVAASSEGMRSAGGMNQRIRHISRFFIGTGMRLIGVLEFERSAPFRFWRVHARCYLLDSFFMSSPLADTRARSSVKQIRWGDRGVSNQLTDGLQPQSRYKISEEKLKSAAVACRCARSWEIWKDWHYTRQSLYRTGGNALIDENNYCLHKALLKVLEITSLLIKSWN